MPRTLKAPALKKSRTAAPQATPIPVYCVSASGLDAWLSKQTPAHQAWVKQIAFKAKEHTHCALPAAQGGIEAILVGISEKPDLWSYAHLPVALPADEYEIREVPPGVSLTQLALGVRLGAYQFTPFKSAGKRAPVTFHWPSGVNESAVKRMADAIIMGRDLINLPANKMGPAELQKAAEMVAKRHKAECATLVGDALLKENYPTIHAVGRAAAQAPRLMDIRWGNPKHPKVTLVGKGVTFDTGGLNIKTGGGMKLMKKDMGGAATVLALADMILGANLPIRLRVLVPAVENSISAEAMRPSDVVRTRKSTTVEVNDTDAEGRLILCDALTEADRESPDLIVDCATLTGAARIAVGAEIAAYFTDDDALAADLQRHAKEQSDPMWRLPLWEPYRDHLHSHVADYSNISDNSYGGAIVAALFLKHFVEKAKAWVHFDMMAWNPSRKAGRPVGGEIMAARALLALLTERYGAARKRGRPRKIPEAQEASAPVKRRSRATASLPLSGKQETEMAKLKNTSARIRYLHQAGLSHSEIAVKLGKRYQHVYNVLKTPLKFPR